MCRFEVPVETHANGIGNTLLSVVVGVKAMRMHPTLCPSPPATGFEALEPHRRFRPPLGARPATHPRAWWQYAGGAVRWQVPTPLHNHRPPACPPVRPRARPAPLIHFLHLPL